MPDYKVKVGDKGPIMIKANNQAQARNFAVRNIVTVETLTVEEAIRLAGEGEKLQDATKEPEPAQNGE
jgi:hypothetical protein